MRICTEHELRALGRRLLEAAGVPADEASVVTDELVTTSLLGLDSHGIIRLAQYIRQLREGMIKPGRQPLIVRESSTTLVVDAQWNFGMVAARFMTDAVAERAATHHLACAVSLHAHHVGRLGSFVERLAHRGLFGIAAANASRQGHYVAPWGGTKGRLGTNPFAYGCPNGDAPLVFDMSTCMIAEGSIRSARHRGDALPEGCILDPEGLPSVNPDDFYRDGGGTILPFGGPWGYKGFGLGLLVELLGSALAGAGLTPDDTPDAYINGFFIMALDPGAMCGADLFQRRVQDLCAYLKETPTAPGYESVILPGERDRATAERRRRDGVPVPDGTWDELGAAADALGLGLDDLLNKTGEER